MWRLPILATSAHASPHASPHGEGSPARGPQVDCHSFPSGKLTTKNTSNACTQGHTCILHTLRTEAQSHCPWSSATAWPPEPEHAVTVLCPCSAAATSASPQPAHVSRPVSRRMHAAVHATRSQHQSPRRQRVLWFSAAKGCTRGSVCARRSFRAGVHAVALRLPALPPRTTPPASPSHPRAAPTSGRAAGLH